MYRMKIFDYDVENLYTVEQQIICTNIFDVQKRIKEILLSFDITPDLLNTIYDLYPDVYIRDVNELLDYIDNNRCVLSVGHIEQSDFSTRVFVQKI